MPKIRFMPEDICQQCYEIPKLFDDRGTYIQIAFLHSLYWWRRTLCASMSRADTGFFSKGVQLDFSLGGGGSNI